MAQATNTEPASETTANGKPMVMVVTLKSGAQLRMDVSEYTIQRNHFGALMGIKWQAADHPTATIEHLDMEEVAAVHTEWAR